MGRPTRNETLMQIAIAYADRSTCLRRKVGAVIGIDGRPLSVGYNGAPPGLPHCTPETCRPHEPCFRAVHAEANAIAWAARNGVATKGAILYTTVSPCNECSKLIIAAGIIEVHYWEKYRDTAPLEVLLRARVQPVWVGSDAQS